MAKYAYMKLDEHDPDPARQAVLLDSIGGFDRIFVDDMTSDKLIRALNILETGDVLFVASADRICSGIKDFMSIVETVKQTGADFCCLDISFDTRASNSDNIIKVVETLFAIEAQTMSRKKKTGIRRAREQGRRVGRPPVSIPAGFRTICRNWQEGTISGTEAIRMSGLKSTSFYKKAAELGYTSKRKTEAGK